MREKLRDYRDTVENIKKATVPNKEKKKKSRRAIEVGINISADSGTSLLRKSSDVPLVMASSVLTKKSSASSILRDVDIASMSPDLQAVECNERCAVQELPKSTQHQEVWKL